MGQIAEQIEQKLIEHLSPEKLIVEDDSHRHAGHAGAPAGGESHFNVEVVSEIFNGKSRLERQRLVYRILAEELSGPIHALAVITKTPEEYAGLNP